MLVSRSERSETLKPFPARFRGARQRRTASVARFGASWAHSESHSAQQDLLEPRSTRKAVSPRSEGDLWLITAVKAR